MNVKRGDGDDKHDSKAMLKRRQTMLLLGLKKQSTMINKMTRKMQSTLTDVDAKQTMKSEITAKKKDL